MIPFVLRSMFSRLLRSTGRTIVSLRLSFSSRLGYVLISASFLLWSSAEENVGQNPRAEQCDRRIQEARDPVELLSNSRAALRRSVNTLHIPLDWSQPSWSLSSQLREAEIFHQRTVPGRIYLRIDRPKPARSELGWDASLALGQKSIEPFRLKCADRDSLTVNRIKAARRIARYDQPVRKRRSRS